MDISETYAKMNEKAEEVQREWKPKFGDRVKEGFVSRIYINGNIGFITAGGEGRISKELATCIFTQDQLQEMLSWDWSLTCDHYKDDDECFLRLFENRETNLVWAFNDNSPERVLLHGVMKEKFNKVWNGKDWIIEEKGGKYHEI